MPKVLERSDKEEDLPAKIEEPVAKESNGEEAEA